MEMAQNDEGTTRKCMSGHNRPFLQRCVTHFHTPLNIGVNVRIDLHVMSMLPIFHGKPFKDPYRHVYELSQVCEINHIHNVLKDVMKMKFFLLPLEIELKISF